MEKIQAEAILPVQAGSKARRYAASEADASFDQMLKERTRTAEENFPKVSSSGKQPEKTDPEDGKTAVSSDKTTGKDSEAGKADPAGEAVKNDLLLSGLALSFSAVVDSFADEQQPGTEEILSGISEIPETAEEGLLPPLIQETPASEVTLQPVVSEAIKTEEAVLPVSQEKLPVLTETAAVPEEVLPVDKKEPEIQSAVPQSDAGEMTFRKEEPTEEAGRSKTMPAENTAIRKPQTGDEFVQKAAAEEEAAPAKTREVRTGEKNRAETANDAQFLRAADLRSRSYSTVQTETSASAQVRTTPSSLVEDVGKALVQRLPQSNGALTIELEPASLGRLTIKVLYEDGKATVSILSTNPKTLELLSARASELASILEERTGQETVVYTQPSEQEPPFDERQGEGRQQEREPDDKERREKDGQDSFAQQLRLGLI